MNLNCPAPTQEQVNTSTASTVSATTSATTVVDDSSNVESASTNTPVGNQKMNPPCSSIVDGEDTDLVNCRRIQVSREKRPLNFFVTLSKKFLLTDDVIELSGLGLAVTTVVTVAELLKSHKLVSIKHIKTSLVTPHSDENNNNANNQSHGNSGGGSMAPKAKIQIWIEKTEHFDSSAPSFGYQVRNMSGQHNSGSPHNSGANVIGGNNSGNTSSPQHHHHHHHHHLGAGDDASPDNDDEDEGKNNGLGLDMNNNGHHMMLSAGGGVQVIANTADGANGYPPLGDGNTAGHT